MISTEIPAGVGSSSGFGDGLRDSWRKSARYSVVCSFPASKGMPERVVARGLAYARACQIRDAIDQRAKSAKPVSSAWVRRLYAEKLESPNTELNPAEAAAAAVILGEMQAVTREPGRLTHGAAPAPDRVDGPGLRAGSEHCVAGHSAGGPANR